MDIKNLLDFVKASNENPELVQQLIWTSLIKEIKEGTRDSGVPDNIRDEILFYLNMEKISQSEAAFLLQKTPQAFFNQLSRESLRYKEAKELANKLGYEILWVKSGKETSEHKEAMETLWGLRQEQEDNAMDNRGGHTEK